MHKSNLILLVVIFLHSACNTSLKGFNQKPSSITADSLYPSPDVKIATHSDWTKGHYPEKINEFKNKPLEFKDIVFLGNSITEGGGDWASRFNNPKVKNRGISGDVTDGVLKRLGEIYYYKPASVFILIGINDLFNPSLPAEYVANNIIEITRIIKKNSSHTKVYVQTILPTTTQNIVAKIKATNDILRDHASRKTYSLIELHSFFADDNDLMKKEFTKDGVHLNEAGYNLWVSKVKKYIY